MVIKKVVLDNSDPDCGMQSPRQQTGKDVIKKRSDNAAKKSLQSIDLSLSLEADKYETKSFIDQYEENS